MMNKKEKIKTAADTIPDRSARKRLTTRGFSFGEEMIYHVLADVVLVGMHSLSFFWSAACCVHAWRHFTLAVDSGISD